MTSGRLCATACSALLLACGEPDPGAEAAPAASEPATLPDAPAPVLSFEEVASPAGLDFWHENGAFGDKWMPETMGSGGGFFDYDGDGLPDVFLVNSMRWPGREDGHVNSTSRLYRNLGDGSFQDVTRAVGLSAVGYGMGAAFADYDGDGDVDIFMTAVGPNWLLRNDGGRFTNVIGGSGLETEDGGQWSTAATWLDADRDGWLDLFVCDYVRWTPDTDMFHSFDGVTKGYATPELYAGDTCRLYGNRGDGTFRDRTEEAGLFHPEGKPLGVAVEDFDDDGWLDLVVAHDTWPNALYRNRGDGTFEEIAVRAGVAVSPTGVARAGMGIGVADLAGDGRLAIGIGNFSHESVALFVEAGDWLFEDRAAQARLERATLPTLTFGLVFADFDLDGALDLMLANGHIEPTIHAADPSVDFRQPPQLFLGDGLGAFVDVSDRVGVPFRRDMLGRGLAAADYDRDGDLDALISTNGNRPRLFRNDLPQGSNSWIALALEGRTPNAGAVGAVVHLYTGSRAQRRIVHAGGSYLSQSETNPVHFGLGRAPRADSVLVRWPSGSTTRHGPFEAGATHSISEPGGR